MKTKLTREYAQELAAAPRRPWGPGYGTPRISASILRSDGFLEAGVSGRSGGGYALFEEMEDKDPHLYSVLQTRRNGVLARGRTVAPASTSPADLDVARWLDRSLQAIPRFDSALLHLLDSISRGMAVLEVVWGYDEEGRVVPVELKPRHAGRFNLGPRGELFLDDPAWARSGGYALEGERGELGRRLPERKFVLMRFDASDERPYGRGLCERVFWFWWFKKVNLKFWVMYNEKFGAPTVIARHDPGLSPVERDRLLDVIASLQADSGITLPEGVSIDLLESSRSGSAETYRDLAAWCNEEISRAVLGQTLTTSEGSRSGSFAMAKVHEAVRFDYVRSDAGLLMDTVNSQLVRWMIDFNYGEKFPAPLWQIDVRPEFDPETEINVDRQLIRMGVPLSTRHFYSKYGRPAPAEGERELRYDDSNLFQYHLQYGVLTINEVRASLGLRPVAWGERPTSLADSRSIPPTPPRGAASDAETEEEARERLRDQEAEERDDQPETPDR